MPISITCPGCGKRLKARDELAGKVLPCPHCKQPVHVAQPEDEIANLLLQDGEPAEAPSPPEPEPEPETGAAEERPAPVRRQPRPAPVPPPARARKDAVASLPPLTTNEPPLWLRHLHWLLALALLPLAFTLLNTAEEDDFEKRFERTMEEAPLDVQLRVARVVEKLEKGEGSRHDLLAALPGGRLAGAFLPHDSFAHWGFAAGAAVLFMAFFLFLASQKMAEPLHILGMGLFTATVGILLLLLLQVLANVSQGVWLRGANIVVVIFYIVKMIGYSYQAALDPENGFFLSFLGYTLGVGFCEEVCKALPLLWYYRERRDQSWRTAFLWGLASGAGFGIAEGIMYSSNHYNGVSGADAYVVRFISCVALHALWTGSVAITIQQNQKLLQDVGSWYEYIPRLYFVVGVPMVLHGLYDTLLKKDMNAGALAVAVLSFLFLAFQISRLRGADDAAATAAMLREYKRRREAMS
jgi:RsiW-degrading membrane proteinase PrsW (M82 family)